MTSPDLPTLSTEDQALVPSSRTAHHSDASIQPHPLTRGVTLPYSNRPDAVKRPTTFCLDWLTYTVPTEIGRDRAFPQHPALALTGEVLPNHKGYDTTLALTHGKLSFHTRYPQHRICVSFSGLDLALLRAAGLDPVTLLQHALQCNGKLTSLHFALDYYGPSSPGELYQLWKSGALRTPARECSCWQNASRGPSGHTRTPTVYLGSKKSSRSLCCYDKAVERGEPGPWTRLELRTRDEWATRLGRAMTVVGIAHAGKQALRSFVSCNLAWYVAATEGPAVYIDPAQQRQSNRKNWLLKQVLPSLLAEIREGSAVGDFEVLHRYQDALADCA